MLETMRKHLTDYFIPHGGNDHKPHMVRDASVVVLLLVVVLTFGFSVFQSLLIRTSTEFTAAVLPSVLVDLANEDREDEGLSQLTVNPVLAEAARMKAEDMAEYEYFAHTSPSGINPWYWFYRAGYEFVHAGENLAVNFVDSEDVEQAWMDSPGHRANILNGNFTEVGIAAVPGTYKGKKTIFVVQLFGTPAATSISGAVERTPVAAAVENPQVAGEQVENVPAPDMYREVTLTQEFVPSNPTQDVVGAAAQETQVAVSDAPQNVENEPATAPVEKVSQASAWQEFLTQPRSIVKGVYFFIGALLLLVIVLMIWHQAHHRHAREFLHGVALLLLITLLLYLNFLLLSAGHLVV